MDLPDPDTMTLPEEGPFLLVYRLGGVAIDAEDHDALRELGRSLHDRTDGRATLLAIPAGDGIEILVDDDLRALGLVRIDRALELLEGHKYGESRCPDVTPSCYGPVLRQGTPTPSYAPDTPGNE